MNIIVDNKNNKLESINILIVGTGEMSGHIFFVKDLYELLDIEDKELNEYLVNEIINKEKVCFYDYDEDEDRPLVRKDDLPKKWHKYFISKVQIHDLDNCINRLRLFKKVKELFNVKIINYTTFDMYMLSPSDNGFIFKNPLIGNKIGADINYIEHINDDFQSYINTSKKKYDMIWFFGCTNPHYVIDMSESYIEDFKNVIDNGLIIYSDGWDDIKLIDKNSECLFCKKPCNELTNCFDKTQVYGFREAFNFVDKLKSWNNEEKGEANDKINWFLENLMEISTGIYKFK